MFHRWAALVLVLALCAISPKNAAGQTQSNTPRGHSAGGFGNNYPNPFNPFTYIPFTIGDESCAGVGENHVVTVKIVNTLAMPIVSPILYGPSATSTNSSSALNGQRLKDITLQCGSYLAYWDGKNQRGEEAASGVYMVQLFVDGRLLPGTKKIFYAK